MRDATRTLPVRALLLLMAGLFAVALPALAQTSGSYDLSWHVVAGGGGQCASVAYTMMGTAGQAAAGMMAGETYTLAGGFWAGGAPPGVYAIYLPLALKGYP